MTFYRKTEDRDIFNMPVGNLTTIALSNLKDLPDSH